MGNNEKHDANRDPISGAPGAHPIGTGVGAAGGAVTGAAVGSIAGPVGTAVGGLVGAVVGGLAGKGVGEAVNPTVEDAYWRDNHTKEPYYSAQYRYDDYLPAYRVGYTSRAQYSDRTWDQAEPELRADWERTKGPTRMNWDDARQATRAAWHRVERALPGDADHDGR